MKHPSLSSFRHRKTRFCREAVLTTLLLFVSLCSQAQKEMNKRHEIYFGMGLFNTYLSDKYDKLTQDIPYYSEGECFDIPINLSLDYKYRLTKRISVGATMGFTNDRNNRYDPLYSDIEMTKSDSKDAQFYDMGESNAYMTYIIPEVSYTWFLSDNRIFRMYSGAGLGLALLKEKITVPKFECDKTSAKFAYNVTCIGLSVGGESFKFFSELNIGCKGAYTVGLLVRL